MFKKRYSDRYADCPGVGKITDEMVAKYVRNHTHWWDRLDYRKIIDATITAFGMLAGYIEKPKKETLVFLKKKRGFSNPSYFFMLDVGHRICIYLLSGNFRVLPTSL